MAGERTCHAGLIGSLLLAVIGPVSLVHGQTTPPQQAAVAADAASQPVLTEPTSGPATRPATSSLNAATSRPGVPTTMYDTNVAKPILPRDWLERISLERGIDFKLVDALLDERTKPPRFNRRPPGTMPTDAVMAEGVPLLPDTNPFPEPTLIPPKEPSIRLGAALSTYRTREKTEVLSALQPLIDLVQREVNVRSAVDLLQSPREIYFALLDGRDQMIISNVFDYLLQRPWFATVPNNGVIPLAWVQPANPRTGEADADFPGVQGTSVELIIRRDAGCKAFADLRGRRLSLTANLINAPGTFLTQLLVQTGQPLDQPFFGKVMLRRYAKDAMIDVYKGMADVACVDQGTVAAVYKFYGIQPELRTLAVSPRYNLDVMYTSNNNVATHRTEIELTQTQVTTLGKNAEGQEVLFLFDTREWHTYEEGDFAVAEQYFGYFVTFLGRTPVDLKPLLDPAASVERWTYDIHGDQ